MSGPEREIPPRELRNNVAKVLRDVEAGTRLRVMVRGRPVAELVPPATGRRFVRRADFERIIEATPLDRRFARDVDRAVGGTIEQV